MGETIVIGDTIVTDSKRTLRYCLVDLTQNLSLHLLEITLTPVSRHVT